VWEPKKWYMRAPRTPAKTTTSSALSEPSGAVAPATGPAGQPLTRLHGPAP
jgi:hypothetical protein